jgi:outer membrane protein assembly factor BamA
MTYIAFVDPSGGSHDAMTLAIAHVENERVVLDVSVSETLRLLPVVVIRVTDENGLSAGPGVRGLNLFGRGMQLGAAVRFGGETSVAVSLDGTTVTPGTWSQHIGFSDTSRRNSIYDFDEHATTVEGRFGRNWNRGRRTGVTGDVLRIDTGPDGPSLSPDGVDVIPTVGTFITLDTLDISTNPRSGTWAELEVDRLFGDASSWSFILDGRRFQPLSARHGLGMFALTTFQTGEPAVQLPEYLRFALGGANSVRGWDVGSRRGRNQFIGTLEYSYVVKPVTAFSVAGLNLYAGVQLVGFADLGLAWDDGDDFDTRTAIDGYGFGMRLLVPFVDVIRVEMAWGEPGRGSFAYFGVSLKAARQRQRVR